MATRPDDWRSYSETELKFRDEPSQGVEPIPPGEGGVGYERDHAFSSDGVNTIKHRRMKP